MRYLLYLSLLFIMSCAGGVDFNPFIENQSPAEAANERVFRDCSDCPDMISVAPGSFIMGSDGEQANERPAHSVSIAGLIAVGIYEVTFVQWDACIADGYCEGGGDMINERPAHDEGWGRDTHPVMNVSWDDIQKYLTWLNIKTGEPYRLLSEAEWEYVARAGSDGDYSTGENISHDLANYGKDECCGGLVRGADSWEYTAPVGSFAPNAFGLYDLHGNVWEWTQDCFRENYSTETDIVCLSGRHAVRGGAWYSAPGSLRSAFRINNPSDTRFNDLGFRVARDIND